MSHPLTRPASAIAGLVGAAVVLHLAGAAVPSPPLGPARLPGWWSEAGPLTAFLGTLRVLAITASCWLVLVTVLDLAATVLRARPLKQLAAGLAPAAWRNLVLRPLTASLVVAPQVMVPAAGMTTVAAAPEPAIGVEEPPPPIDGPVVIEMRRAVPGDAAAAASEADRRPASGPEPPTTTDPEADEAPDRPSDDAGPHQFDERGGGSERPDGSDTDDVPLLTMRAGHGPGATTAEPVPAASGPSTGEGPAEASPSEGARSPSGGPVLVFEPPTSQPEPGGLAGPTHVVAPGEHLWSIAAAHLAESTGTTPSASEVAPYWRELIELNRADLPDPGNPDLLLPGVELRLPPAG